MLQYKQRCISCKTQYVVVTSKQRFAKCYDCQRKELQHEIKDPEMKKFFDIPEEFYQQNQFLRNIKVSYLRYGALTERQISAFKKVVEQLGKG